MPARGHSRISTLVITRGNRLYRKNKKQHLIYEICRFAPVNGPIDRHSSRICNIFGFFISIPPSEKKIWAYIYDVIVQNQYPSVQLTSDIRIKYWILFHHHNTLYVCWTKYQICLLCFHWRMISRIFGDSLQYQRTNHTVVRNTVSRNKDHGISIA